MTEQEKRLALFNIDKKLRELGSAYFLTVLVENETILHGFDGDIGDASSMLVPAILAVCKNCGVDGIEFMSALLDMLKMYVRMNPHSITYFKEESA